MSKEVKYYGPGIPASVALKEFNRIQEYIRIMKLKK
jgi:hypothetical protein